MINLQLLALPDATPGYPVLRKVGPADLKDALTKGVNDFLPILDFLGQAVIHRFVQHDLCDHLHISSLAPICRCSFRSCRVSLWLALSWRSACMR